MRIPAILTHPRDCRPERQCFPGIAVLRNRDSLRMGPLHFRMKRHLITALLLAATILRLSAQLELRKEDHISIIGNTLADRLQFDGTLEAMIHQTFPQLDLSVRNLGFAADELTIRQRSENFGAPEEWLKKTKADVVFAFFGFNESFKGPEGVEKFK